MAEMKVVNCLNEWGNKTLQRKPLRSGEYGGPRLVRRGHHGPWPPPWSNCDALFLLCPVDSVKIWSIEWTIMLSMIYAQVNRVFYEFLVNFCELLRPCIIFHWFSWHTRVLLINFCKISSTTPNSSVKREKEYKLSHKAHNSSKNVAK